MEEEKIEITRTDLAKAIAKIPVDSELSEIVNQMPVLMLLFPIIGVELWKTLVEDKKENKEEE